MSRIDVKHWPNHSSAELIGEHYSVLADWMESRPWYNDNHVLAAVGSLISGRPKKVLELCCGSGLLLAKLSERYPDTMFTGVDISHRMVELARERQTSLKNVEVLRGDWISNLREANCSEYFDVVIVKNALHLLENVNEKLADLTEIVHPNSALIVIETVSPNAVSNRFIRDLFRFVDSNHMKQAFFTSHSLTSLMRSNLWVSSSSPIYVPQGIELKDWLERKCSNKRTLRQACEFIRGISDRKVRKSMLSDAQIGELPHQMLRLQYIARYSPSLHPTSTADTRSPLQLGLV